MKIRHPMILRHPVGGFPMVFAMGNSLGTGTSLKTTEMLHSKDIDTHTERKQDTNLLLNGLYDWNFHGHRNILKHNRKAVLE